MPYSSEYNVIFVHIPKNAGTSIEKALGIYGVNQKDGSPTSQERVFGNGMQHYTIDEITKTLKQHDVSYDYARSFAVLRDPAERFVSHYKWTPQGEKSGKTFEDFFFNVFLPTIGDMDVEARHRWPQYKFVSSKGVILVRYFIKFSDLADGFYKLTNELSIITKSDIGHDKKSTKSKMKQAVPQEILEFIHKFYVHDYALISCYSENSSLTDTYTTKTPPPVLPKHTIRSYAISTIKQLIALPPRSSRYHFGLSILEYKEGNIRGAISHIKKYTLEYRSSWHTTLIKSIYYISFITKTGKTRINLYLLKKILKRL